MSLIHKMNVGNTDYDIQDRLMPDAIGQAGQVLKVKDDGSGLEFSTIESGGGKLYKHVYTKSIEISGDPKNTVGSINLVFYSSSPTQLTGSEYYNKIYTQDNTVRANCTIGGGYLNYIVKQSSYMNLNESRGDYSIQVSEIFNPASTTATLITPMLYYKEFVYTITEI